MSYSSNPVDLSVTKNKISSPSLENINNPIKMDIDLVPPFSMPLPLNPPNFSSNSNCSPNSSTSSSMMSSIFSPSYDSFNAAGQPILDLHSALNNIHKSFTIGSRVGNSMKLGSNGQSPSPPPPCPNPIHPLAAYNHMGSTNSTTHLTGPLGPPPPPPPLINSHHHHHGFNNFMIIPPTPLPPSTTTRRSSPSPRTATPQSPTPSSPPILSKSGSSTSGLTGSKQIGSSVELNNVIQATLKDHQVSKYNQLLALLEEMNKDVRPSYAGSKSSSERLKRGIAHARILVREALLETSGRN